MPHYYEPIEYDAELDRTVIRGITFSLRPYALEIQGPQARVWVNLLNASTYFHRKANGRPEVKSSDSGEL